MTILLLCFASFFAGFVDSIAGGGGLIQLPALLAVLPAHPIPVLLGTNKFASFWGTSLAVIRYRQKRIHVKAPIIISCAIVAWAASWGGAHLVSHVNGAWLKPAIVLILIGVTLFTLTQKNFGSLDRHLILNRTRTLKVLLGAAIIGLYDGFLGPGTGGFLIFMFISVLGLDFLRASASAKWVNWATNFSAVAYFVFTDQVMFFVGIPMALANMAGNFVGTHYAVRKGNAFVRKLFVIVLTGIFLKLLYDILYSR